MDENQLLIYGAVKLRRKFLTKFENDYSGMEISASEAIMLKVITEREGITVTALGDFMGYNKSLVTKNMKLLTSEGYVITEPIDGRTVSIKATDKGKEFIAEANRKGNDFSNDVFKNCTDEERSKFFEILGKLKLD